MQPNWMLVGDLVHCIVSKAFMDGRPLSIIPISKSGDLTKTDRHRQLGMAMMSNKLIRNRIIIDPCYTSTKKVTVRKEPPPHKCCH